MIMKTEEELFADFINEYHSNEAMEIVSDPLRYIYWRNSSDFASYKIRHAMIDLRDMIRDMFKICAILNALKKVLNKISRRNK